MTPMSGAEYRALFAQLQMPHSTREGAALLGISERMSVYYAGDYRPIPAKIAKLLRLLVSQNRRTRLRKI
jgi:hypothetical protein